MRVCHSKKTLDLFVDLITTLEQLRVHTWCVGAQNAILGGGRYDGLAELLGSEESAPGIGFAIGEDRLILALQESRVSATKGPDVFIAPIGDGSNRKALVLASELRSQKIVTELGDRSFKLRKLLEVASKMGARFALIAGEDEFTSENFGLKTLPPESKSLCLEPIWPKKSWNCHEEPRHPSVGTRLEL